MKKNPMLQDVTVGLARTNFKLEKHFVRWDLGVFRITCSGYCKQT